MYKTLTMFRHQEAGEAVVFGAGFEGGEALTREIVLAGFVVRGDCRKDIGGMVLLRQGLRPLDKTLLEFQTSPFRICGNSIESEALVGREVCILRQRTRSSAIGDQDCKADELVLVIEDSCRIIHLERFNELVARERAVDSRIAEGRNDARLEHQQRLQGVKT